MWSSSSRARENRVHRRAKLVTHVGEKPALEFVGAPQMLGLLIEFGVERHHATVGVLELAIEPEEVVLPDAQRLQDVEQLLVLLLHLGQRVMGPLLHQGIHELVQVLSDEHGRVAGQELRSTHGRALVWRGRDMYLIHEPLGAAQAQAQAGRRLVLPGENLQGGEYRALVTDRNLQELRPGLAFEVERNLPPARVGQGVAGDFRYGRSNAGLILGIEPQQLGNLSRSLAGEHHILLTLQGHHEDTHTCCLTPVRAVS